MSYQILRNSIAVVLVVFLLFSCDKEFVDAGSNMLDGDDYDLTSKTFNITTNNFALSDVETGNLPVNSIGVYEHSNKDFGILNHSFVSQVALTEENPDLGELVSIESVMLSIPFYSRLKSTDAQGKGVYELDSIRGDRSSQLRLRVHESNYMMNEFSDDLITKRKYYSKDKNTFKNNLGVQDLVNDTIVLSETSIDFTDENGTKLNLTPRVYMPMKAEFFRDKIFKSTSQLELLSQEKFKSHFRGLYFETELISGKGMLMNLDFSKGQIVITYQAKDSGRKVMYISLAGNTANFFDQKEAKLLTNRLVLKGGNGAVGEINLFPTKSELDELKKDPWLINEANLIFKVDPVAMAGEEAQLPERIYVYDIQNDSTLVDYRNDFTTGSTFKFNKNVYSGLKEKIDGRYQYKVRITEHIHNIIHNDSTNVKLGVSLTDNILDTSKRKNNYKDKNNNVGTVNVPVAHTYSPFGVIFYDENANDKLELKIHYSKPKQ